MVFQEESDKRLGGGVSRVVAGAEESDGETRECWVEIEGDSIGDDIRTAEEPRKEETRFEEGKGNAGDIQEEGDGQKAADAGLHHGTLSAMQVIRVPSVEKASRDTSQEEDRACACCGDGIQGVGFLDVSRAPESSEGDEDEADAHEAQPTKAQEGTSPSSP